MRRRTLIFGGFVALLSLSPSEASEWTLITKEEFEREGSAPHVEGSLPINEPDAPTITVEQPDPAKPVKPPVSIRISFHPKSGATIDVSSFRAKYGFLGIDITEKILANAKITAAGVVADNAVLPSGQHKVTVQIADNLHRVGTRTFNFTVV